jgi:ankyrin repeat protein
MENPLIQACYENNLEKVKSLLLDRGTNPNLQNNHGWTALMTASCYGRIDLVRLLLLDRRADPNLQDSDGWTALRWASWLRYTDIVKLLEAYAGWNRNVAQPLMDLDIFPEGLIREHLTI